MQILRASNTTQYHTVLYCSYQLSPCREKQQNRQSKIIDTYHRRRGRTHSSVKHAYLRQVELVSTASAPNTFHHCPRRPRSPLSPPRHRRRSKSWRLDLDRTRYPARRVIKRGTHVLDSPPTHYRLTALAETPAPPHPARTISTAGRNSTARTASACTVLEGGGRSQCPPPPRVGRGSSSTGHCGVGRPGSCRAGRAAAVAMMGRQRG